MPWYKYVRNQDPLDSTRTLATPSFGNRFSFVTIGHKVELDEHQAEAIISRGKYVIEPTTEPIETSEPVVDSRYRIIDVTTGASVPGPGLEFTVVDGEVQSISYRV